MKNKLVRTYNGHYIDPLKGRECDIWIGDIAHALSMLCRWGGHVDTHLSVAEHSINVARTVFVHSEDAYLAYAALLHDATEAYMQDVVSPVKHRLKSYCSAEKRLEKVIAKKFLPIKLKAKERKLIKEADLSTREVESWTRSGFLTAKQAKCNFLRVYYYLIKAVRNKYPFGDILAVFDANCV